MAPVTICHRNTCLMHPKAPWSQGRKHLNPKSALGRRVPARGPQTSGLHCGGCHSIYLRPLVCEAAIGGALTILVATPQAKCTLGRISLSNRAVAPQKVPSNMRTHLCTPKNWLHKACGCPSPELKGPHRSVGGNKERKGALCNHRRSKTPRVGNKERKSALCNHRRPKSPSVGRVAPQPQPSPGVPKRWAMATKPLLSRGSPTLNAGDEIRSGKLRGRSLFNMSLAYLKSPEHFEFKHMW